MTVHYVVFCGEVPAAGTTVVITWPDTTTTLATSNANGTGTIRKGFIAAQAALTLTVTVTALDGPVATAVVIS